MAVLLETSKGDMVIDLHCDECLRTTKNFLKLCKIKYYNNCLFHSVTRDFAVQTGDPTGTGRGGDSIYGKLFGDQARFFEDETRPGLKHKAKGTVSMASAGENLNASQFLITARDECDALDGKNTVFGHVSEGLDVLDAINEAYCDDAGRPWQNIRVKHTIILDDPFDDPRDSTRSCQTRLPRSSETRTTPGSRTIGSPRRLVATLMPRNARRAIRRRATERWFWR